VSNQSHIVQFRSDGDQELRGAIQFDSVVEAKSHNGGHLFWQGKEEVEEISLDDIG
jgi:hypothetical protein